MRKILLRIIISFFVIYTILKTIIILQEDFNRLIQTYADILTQLIDDNKATLNKCKPPLCEIIDNNWKFRHIEKLKQCLLHNGNFHNWSSFKVFKSIIIDSIHNFNLSRDPFAYLDSNLPWFKKIQNSLDYAESIFTFYCNQTHISHIHTWKFKLFPFIIPILDYFGLSNKLLYSILHLISLHYGLIVILISFKYYSFFKRK